MTVTRIPINVTTEDELTAEMYQLSQGNSYVITCYARLGKADIYLYDNQPTTDTPDTVQTYKYYGGFIRNEAIVKPTKRWMDRYNYIPISK